MLLCFQTEVNLVGETVLGLSKLKQTCGQSATKSCRGCLFTYTDMSYVTYSHKSTIHPPPKNRQQKCLGCSMNFRDKHQYRSKGSYSFLPTCFILRSCEISYFPMPLQQFWDLPCLHHISVSVCSIFRTFTITQGTVQTQLHLVSTLTYTRGNNTSYKHNPVLPFCL